MKLNWVSPHNRQLPCDWTFGIAFPFHTLVISCQILFIPRSTLVNAFYISPFRHLYCPDHAEAGSEANTLIRRLQELPKPPSEMRPDRAEMQSVPGIRTTM